jgi:hypothetical protein
MRKLCRELAKLARQERGERTGEQRADLPWYTRVDMRGALTNARVGR